MLTGTPFLLFTGDVDGLKHELFEAWSQFRHHLYAVIAKNLFVINLNNPIILALCAFSDIEADGVVVNIRASSELNVAGWDERLPNCGVATHFREQSAQVWAWRVGKQSK